jgi:hypothetical protein
MLRTCREGEPGLAESFFDRIAGSRSSMIASVESRCERLPSPIAAAIQFTFELVTGLLYMALLIGLGAAYFSLPLVLVMASRYLLHLSEPITMMLGVASFVVVYLVLPRRLGRQKVTIVTGEGPAPPVAGGGSAARGSGARQASPRLIGGIALLLIVGSVLVPPWKALLPQGMSRPIGWGWFFRPPTSYSIVAVDYGRLALEWLAIFAVSCATLLHATRPKSRSSDHH